MIEILFYVLSFVSIVTGLMVVFAKSPIHSVLSLIVTFFAIAGQYILLNAQFLAIVHIIVYAGAIMVLFLFVLMLLNLNKEAEPKKDIAMKLAGVISASLLMVTLTGALHGSVVTEATLAVNTSNGLVKNLGQVLFKDFVVPFEISSLLFLAAMAGAVLLGKKHPSQITDSEIKKF